MRKALIIGITYEGAILKEWDEKAVCRECGKVGSYVYGNDTSPYPVCAECEAKDISTDDVWEVVLVKEWK